MNVEGTPLFFSAPRAVCVGNKAQRKKETENGLERP